MDSYPCILGGLSRGSRRGRRSSPDLASREVQVRLRIFSSRLGIFTQAATAHDIIHKAAPASLPALALTYGLKNYFPPTNYYCKTTRNIKKNAYFTFKKSEKCTILSWKKIKKKMDFYI